MDAANYSTSAAVVTASVSRVFRETDIGFFLFYYFITTEIVFLLQTAVLFRVGRATRPKTSSFEVVFLFCFHSRHLSVQIG